MFYCSLCFYVEMGLKISFYQVFTLLKNTVFRVSFIPTKTTALALLSAVVWFVMYFYNIYTIFKMSFLTNNVTNIIHSKLRIASQIVDVSKQIQKLTSSFPENIKKLLNIPNCNEKTEKLLLKDTILSILLFSQTKVVFYHFLEYKTSFT